MRESHRRAVDCRGWAWKIRDAGTIDKSRGVGIRAARHCGCISMDGRAVWKHGDRCNIRGVAFLDGIVSLCRRDLSAKQGLLIAVYSLDGQVPCQADKGLRMHLGY